ncbi:MAG: hypothetical protein QM760_11730 [Nibricoccus sp.]
MTHNEIKQALLKSYETDGGINHLDGTNLPSEESVNQLARDFMHILFPGFFDEKALTKSCVPTLVDALLARIETRLAAELEKALRFAKEPRASELAREHSATLLSRLPEIRRVVQTDVTAAYQGDPAARRPRKSSSPTRACW